MPTEAEDILVWFARTAPVAEREIGKWYQNRTGKHENYCLYCNAIEDTNKDNWLDKPENHKPECPWRKAVEYFSK
jgi:hypothetical protein